jgi:GxxExxY protein
MKHIEITDKIIKAFYNVYNELGYGFLEKVYERAMLIELDILGCTAQNQIPIIVFYKGHNVGDYCADIFAEKKVIVEIKTNSNGIAEENEAQLVNYLRGTEAEVGIILNFGKEATFKRKIFDNYLKKKYK